MKDRFISNRQISNYGNDLLDGFSKKSIYAEIFQMTMLLIISALVVNVFTPIRGPFFFFLYIFVWRTRRDYFWFAFFFAISNEPANLFLTSSVESTARLPIFNILPSTSFSVFDLYFFVILFKALHLKKLQWPILSDPFYKFVFFSFLLGSFSAILLGTPFTVYIKNIRAISYYLIALSLIGLFKNFTDIIKIGYVLVPFFIIVLFDQFYSLFAGSLTIAEIINPVYVGSEKVTDIMTGAIRPVMRGVYIVFFELIIGLTLLGNRQFRLTKNIASIFIGVSVLSIILSGTRSWIVIYFVIVFIYFKNTKQIKALLSLTILTSIVAFLFALLGTFDFNFVITRIFSFVDAIISGELLNYSTFGSRINNELKYLLAGVKISPIFGVGFSNYLLIYYTDDLGVPNTLLAFGVVGLILFILVLILMIFKIKALLNSFTDSKSEFKSLLPFYGAFVGMLFGYFTTLDFFNFFMQEKVFFIVLLFVGMEMILKKNIYIFK
ncbi:MAG: hypothetical protein K9J12_09825 [Melioribacteraceae bacterium]|nr:hypothetical protein [Melioribacteraceae bacterium]MCF8266418.1 hypothetical protein [Melioribacteraceae bacterium]MCF8297962.1 hypothetical protein [Saprospiraceae bacterium]